MTKKVDYGKGPRVDLYLAAWSIVLQTEEVGIFVILKTE